MSINKNKKKFDINDKFENMFESTEPADKLKGKPIINVEVKKLTPFKNHPFKLYEGERFTDMVESVKTNGIIIPIIIRPLDSEIYEILSGHNRVEAAKSAGLEIIPAIIRDDLDDEEALLIVTETNLIQRSFADLAHSERAAALAVHHESIKNQGKRTDLINEIEKLLKNNENISNNADIGTFRPVGENLRSDKQAAAKYDLSGRNVSRYLRINKLINKLKTLVDEEEISIRAGVELSYLSMDEQCDLFDVLENKPKLKIDMKKSELLRTFSRDGKLNTQLIEDILSGVALKKKARASLPVQSLKIGGKILSKYFKPEQKPEEIQTEIIEALEFYRTHTNTSEK